MARNIPNTIGRDRSQLVGNPGGLAALAQSDYQKLSQLPGFQNISPVTSQNGSYVFDPRDIRDLIRSQRGSPVQASGPALSGPAAQPPGGPVAMDRGYVPPAALTQQAPQQFNVMDPSTWKAYDPNLPMLKGNLRTGKDETGYLDAARAANSSLSGLRDKSYQDEYSRMEELGLFSIGEGGSILNDPTHMRYGQALDPFTGEFKSNQQGLGRLVSNARVANKKKAGKYTAPTIDDVLAGYSAPTTTIKTKGPRFIRSQDSLETVERSIANPYAGAASATKEQYLAADALRPKFEEKYLPKELMGQMQRMVDAGFDLSKTENVTDNDRAVREIVAGLASRGITDLRQIGVTSDAKGNSVYYDKMTGAPIHAGIINFKEGEGNLDINLANKNGQVYIQPKYNAGSKTFEEWMDVAAPALILGMAAGPAGAAAGAAMGGTAAATVAGNALAYGTAGAANAAMNDQNIGQGFLTGAVGGGLGSLGTGVGQVNAGQSLLGSSAPAWQTAAINSGLRGAVSGGLQAGMSGGNVLQGALTGGLGGAVSGGLGAYGTDLAGNSPLMRSLAGVGTSALSGGLKSTFAGRGFGEGAKSGAVSGAMNAGRGFLTRFGRGQA